MAETGPLQDPVRKFGHAMAVLIQQILKNGPKAVSFQPRHWRFGIVVACSYFLNAAWLC